MYTCSSLHPIKSSGYREGINAKLAQECCGNLRGYGIDHPGSLRSLKMKIRRATLEDVPGINALHKDSVLGLCAAHYSAIELSQWTDALRPEKYVALFAGREFLVAEEGEQILGFAVLDLKDSLINATYVSPNAVGRGIGRSLVQAMEGVARQGGVRQLQLSSTLNAVPFYKRLGFTPVKTACNRLPTGVELPCVLMTKHLKG